MSRRSGQILERGENKWAVRIFLGRDAETGKRSYRNHTVHGTKKDAQRYLTATLRDRDLGTFVEPSSDPLGQFLDRWLETAAKPKLKTKTFRDYQNILTRYVRPSLAKRPLVDVTPLDLQAIYKDIQVRGLSARTVRYTHAVVRSALQQAVKWRMLTSNPADAVELPKQSRKEVQVLSAEQTRAFLKAANKDRLGALFSLAVTAGLRPSEYLALKWPDLDLGAGTIRVVLKAANLPTNFRLYDLRHTAATLALEAGVQPKVVSEMLGHASAAFTLDVYSHVLPHMQESAAAKVEALLMEPKRKK